MTSRVIREGEISLNSKRYPLGGDNRRVRTIVTSQYPQKIVLGDVDKDSNPRSSLVVWDDWSGGIGLYSTNGKEGMNRSSFSRADGRLKNNLTLPREIGASSSDATDGYIAAIGEVGAGASGRLFAAREQGLKIRSWTISSNAWSTAGSGGNLHDLPASAISSLNFTLGGTTYLAFAHTSGYTYTSDGSSFTDATDDTVSLAFWDDRLWGISNKGQLWFSVTIGTEVMDANIDLPEQYVETLFVGPDAQGNDILYAATQVGLYAHDVVNSRFVRTSLRWPDQAMTDANGASVQAAATWNGDIYVSPGGMTVYRYNPMRGTVESVGLDRDAGVPVAGLRGEIIHLIGAHTGLFATVNAADASLIWEYNGIGWHYFARTDAIKGSQHISNIGGNYRLYFGSGMIIKYVTLPTGHINPDIDTYNRETTNDLIIHETPWFNAGQNEIDKTAIRVRLDCTGMTSNETVKVEYALNYSSTYESASVSGNPITELNGKSTFTIVANGVTTAIFPKIGSTATPPVANTTSQAGVDFQAIRFKLTLNASTGATATPNVKSLSLEWRRKIPAKYGFAFDIDRTQNYGGRTPKEMKADLITALETSTMVEFTFVSDDGSTQNYYCDVTQMEDLEDTGRTETGTTRLTLVEG